MAFQWDIRIRFVDTDASGRIHYTAMFRYFEAAEFEFLRHLGTNYTNFPDHGFPRVHVECDYKASTQCDDLLSISVELEQLGNSSFTLRFAASSQEGAPIAQGKITVVCLAKATGKPTPIPDGMREALSGSSA